MLILYNPLAEQDLFALINIMYLHTGVVLTYANICGQCWRQRYVKDFHVKLYNVMEK